MNVPHLQGVAKLHTQTSREGRGDQNKDLLLYNHRSETNSFVTVTFERRQ